MELVPVIAYGFRLYRDQSSLYMHVDKSQTHVISFILHIDSSPDAEPWPILIEDLTGSTYPIATALFGWKTTPILTSLLFIDRLS